MENKTYDFIRTIINEDLKNNKNSGRVHTRFPPEPNGYLHIGHAKSILLNYGISQDYNGKFNLRFDDTNPTKEDTEYVESIEEDVKWLGANWEDRKFFASNYFDKLHEFAVQLIKLGKAYVCDLSAEEVKEYRGTLTQAGKNSPYRNRSIEENLDLFTRMKAGEFKDGSKTLRAKIDMASPNMNMRDPAIYRIRRAHHHKTGDKWCIYPMYDFAHGLSDAIEKITHSICTLEFEDHRPLYDWFLIQLGFEEKPQQIEFARLNLSYTMMSKRKLLDLVENNYVNGWDDPRMPTISGMRRRGYTPNAIQDFCKRIGVAKVNSMVDIALLEHCVREDLNKKATRVMAVLNPIKLVITNYPENETEMVLADNNPEDENAGKRELAFSKELYIEKEDFMENAPRKFFRLSIGKEVRLKHAYYVTCTGIDKDKNGNVTTVYCTYDPSTKGGWSNDGRKVKGTLHWVSAKHAINATVNVYEHLFKSENPAALKVDYHTDLNPSSLTVLKNCKLEACLENANLNQRFQFLRKGYYCLDKNSNQNNLVFNLTVSLKDSWAKIQKKLKG